MRAHLQSQEISLITITLLVYFSFLQQVFASMEETVDFGKFFQIQRKLAFNWLGLIDILRGLNFTICRIENSIISIRSQLEGEELLLLWLLLKAFLWPSFGNRSTKEQRHENEEFPSKSANKALLGLCRTWSAAQCLNFN